MSQKFTKQSLKVVVGQICQTIGWGAINSSAMDILVDVLHRYLGEIARTTHLFADQFGRTQPNLDDLGLAFSDLGIEVRELREFVEFVESVPCNLAVPKFPMPKENHLNFLKPGSKEVVTRPVHVHEHLPPTTELAVDTSGEAVGSPQPSPTFKRPGDPVDGAAKRARMGLEEEGRPLREISSVMMTTGGFISPAREGKLPESRIAVPVNDIRPMSPPQQHYPSVPPELTREKKKKVVTGREKVRRKKGTSGEPAVKKLPAIKEVSKLKAFIPPKQHLSHSPHPPPPAPEKSLLQKLAESPHLVVTPVMPSEPAVKLATEPDKQKLNIFKKISKVKEEVVEPVVKEIEPTFSSPGSPSTPKTPEIMRSPEHRKKKKDKDKEKRRKNREGDRVKHDFLDVDRRPKTPEVVEPPVLPPPSIFPFFPHGMMPPSISNPLIPRFPMPMGPNFPNLPMPPPHFMHPIPPPPKLDIPSDFLPTSSKSPLAILLDEKKIGKEHKKDKKDKKKKDRKDKPKKDKKEKHRDEEKIRSKEKKEKREKRKEREKEEERHKEKEKAKEEAAVPKLTLKLGPSSPRPPSPKKLEKHDEHEERHPVPPPKPSASETSDIARISSLFSKHPKPEHKPLHVQTDSLKTPKDPPQEKSPGTIIDKDGNKVWICPACGRPDDGTPMIGCDECDAWYHWVCVGIQVPPDEYENWYCRFCIVKKQGTHSKKKRGRKKKPPV